MQCGILGLILEQKKDISGKINEIWIKFGVELMVMYQHWFCGFNKHSTLFWTLTRRESADGYGRTL